MIILVVSALLGTEINCADVPAAYLNALDERQFMYLDKEIAKTGGRGEEKKQVFFLA